MFGQTWLDNRTLNVFKFSLFCSQVWSLELSCLTLQSSGFLFHHVYVCVLCVLCVQKKDIYIIRKKLSYPLVNEMQKLDADISTLKARHWHGVRSIWRKHRSYASACLLFTPLPCFLKSLKGFSFIYCKFANVMNWIQ